MKKIIYIILTLALVGILFYYSIGSKKEEIVNSPINDSETEYVSYKNSKYSPEFIYPKSWGEVIIKEGYKICPEEGVKYITGDTLQVFDWEFAFNEMKLPGSESIIQVGIRQYELNPQKLNDCGDDFHLKIARKEVIPESLSSFMLNSVTLKSGLSGTYNKEASRLNTEARTQYALFVLQNSRIYILQPYMRFMPYFGSPESKEMEQEFDGDMSNYIKNGKTAENIRKYLEEFTKMTESLKFSAK
jgi:hypothetical protein